jgi:hypothetical protein
MSNLSETEFEVSLDGAFRRSCGPTEFIVTLSILEGSSSCSSEGCRFRPKWGGGESEEPSEGGGSKPKGRKGAAFGGFFDDLTSSDDEASSESGEEGKLPSALRKVARAWERRAGRRVNESIPLSAVAKNSMKGEILGELEEELMNQFRCQQLQRIR